MATYPAMVVLMYPEDSDDQTTMHVFGSLRAIYLIIPVWIFVTSWLQLKYQWLEIGRMAKYTTLKSFYT